MRRLPQALALALAALLAQSPPAAAATAPDSATGAVARLRAGDHPGFGHPGFGRLVIDLPAGASAQAVEDGGDVQVDLAGAGFGAAPRLPRNLVALDISGGHAVLHLAAGATWHAMHLQGRLVIDITDPAGAPAAGPAGARRTALAEPGAPSRPRFSGPPPRPRPAQAAPMAPAPPTPTAMPLQAAPARVAPVPPPPPAAVPSPAAFASDVPAPLAAPLAPVTQAPVSATSVLLADGRLALPFPRGTGAAAFRRDGLGVVVFDAPAALDAGTLAAAPGLAGAQLQHLPLATMLTVPLPADAVLRLAPVPGGWTLAVQPGATVPVAAALRPVPADGTLQFATAAAGRVVPVPDPASGAYLLVGTQTQAGEAVAFPRRAPDFALLPSFQGLVVEPLSDAAVLRATPPGFVLSATAGRSLSLDPAEGAASAVAEAMHLTHRWDLPDLPVPLLRRRLQTATQAAAAAAPGARGPLRLAAAQAALALGMDTETQTLATLAQAEDPQLAQSPDAAGLGAVGALLAGRLDATGALDDPRLAGTDEVAFWRAVRRAMSAEGAPDAAQMFGATLPLLLGYPAPLQARLLPLVAETLAEGGEREAASRLLASRPDDHTLDYARALLAEAEDHSAPALALLDRLALSPDRLTRARAAVAAVELRLRIGGMNAAQAADALERLLYAWRGDGRELALRLRVAALRAQTGRWRDALSVLRETTAPSVAAAWPAEVSMLRGRMQAMFAAALEADARAPLPPVELVALIEENPDLLPPGDAGRAVAIRLADRLMALDLPDRAIPLLARLAGSAPAGPPRAELGARLAELHLAQGGAQGDAGAALAALAATDAPNLPRDLAERRTIAAARATAAGGALGPAVASLAGLDSLAADTARADLLEAAKDWPAATAALADVVRRSVPEAGPLDAAAARLVLRLASAAAQGGDAAVLEDLRQRDLPRFPPGELADMLRVLAAPPVEGVPDLPRAAQEAALARQLPQDLSALMPVAIPR